MRLRRLRHPLFLFDQIRKALFHIQILLLWHTNPGVNDISLMVIQAGTGFLCTGGFNNTVDIDTDGDGISNRFDLDSDGDGCSDAFEGGATIVKTDSLMTAPFGANGFANNKETATESGVFNYTNIKQRKITSYLKKFSLLIIIFLLYILKTTYINSCDLKYQYIFKLFKKSPIFIKK